MSLVTDFITAATVAVGAAVAAGAMIAAAGENGVIIANCGFAAD